MVIPLATFCLATRRRDEVNEIFETIPRCKGQRYVQVFGSFQNRDDGANDKATGTLAGARCAAIVIARTAEQSRMSAGASA